MSEVMRWKLKGFIPGVEGMSKALFQPVVVLAEDFDRVNAERDALQLSLNAADQRIDEQCALMRRLVRNVDQETCCAEDLEQDDQFNYILKSMRKAITAPQ